VFSAAPLQSGDDLLHLSGPQGLGDRMHPTVGLSRAFPVAQLRKFPGVFQGVPEIQDFTTAHKHTGALPDPFRSVNGNDHHGVSAHPSQFPQLRIQGGENGVGIPQASHQKPAHYRTPSGGGFHALAGQQQDAGLDFAKTPFLDRW
jgi:hypothetical protein